MNYPELPRPELPRTYQGNNTFDVNPYSNTGIQPMQPMPQNYGQTPQNFGERIYNGFKSFPQSLGYNGPPRQVGQDPCGQFSGVSNTEPRADQARQLGCKKKMFSLNDAWYNPNLGGGINKSKKFKGGKYKKKSSKKFKGGKTKRKSNKKYKGGKSKK